MSCWFRFLIVPLVAIQAGGQDSRPILAGVSPAPRLHRLAAGVVSKEGIGEASPSLAADGSLLFTREDGDWRRQRPFLARSERGVHRSVAPVPLGEGIVYNAAIAPDGRSVYWCTRGDDDAITSWSASRTDTGWSKPRDLTKTYGIAGGYFTILEDALWFHRDGDIHRAPRRWDGWGRPERLPGPINTACGTEFGQWVSPDERVILFARAVDGDADATGIFVSARAAGGGWRPPEKLALPYGWSITVNATRTRLCFTDGDDIWCVPTRDVGLGAVLGVPRVWRTVRRSYAVGKGGARGALVETRREYFDERGRRLRYERRDGDGNPIIRFMDLHDERRRVGAVYFLERGELPSVERFRRREGAVEDNFYAEWGKPLEREIRMTRDALGRESKAEYFDPKTGRAYAEERYVYDDRGLEIERRFRRDNGKQTIVRRFAYRSFDPGGAWTERVLHLNGELSQVQEREVHRAPAPSQDPIIQTR